MNTTTNTKKLIESALFIAMATVLSVIKILELPYGGSVTLASMLPIVLISYRNGVLWGLSSGLVYGVVQQLLGLKNLTYVSTWQSVLAVILLDYLFAFAVIGLAGAFRKVIKSQNASLAVGAACASVIRYLFHVVSGATVWAGLSIPDKAALIYSLGYNATYMIPETLVLVVAAYYLGSLLDFRSDRPMRLVSDARTEGKMLRFFGWFLISGAVVFDVMTLFGKLQNAETGEFDFSGLSSLSNFNLISIAVVTVLAIAVAAVLFVYAAKKKEEKTAE